MVTHRSADRNRCPFSAVDKSRWLFRPSSVKGVKSSPLTKWRIMPERLRSAHSFKQAALMAPPLPEEP